MARPSHCIVFGRVDGKDVYFNQDGTHQGNAYRAELMDEKEAVDLIDRLASRGIKAGYDDYDYFFGEDYFSDDDYYVDEDDFLED